jgi:transposase
MIQVKLSDERLRAIPDEHLARLSREDLIILFRNEHRLRIFLEGHVHELEEKVFEFEGKYFRVRSKLFSPSSEKRPAQSSGRQRGKSGKPRAKAKKLPSERYPNAEIIDKHITCEEPPQCNCCGNAMQDSGMTETSEYLAVIPKQYIVVRQHRHKYRCQACHGSVVTTPNIPRVIPGSSYSDELVIDATLSKYCDLIPMERYCQMAKRQGFAGIPPQSLIGASFKLKEFLKAAYDKVKQETLTTLVLLADETPHRMLEGDDKTGWYLWGFSNPHACFYECHDTRSGDVASTLLKDSNCQVLLTDVYSGYKKAVREANEERTKKNIQPIQMAYCNSHARRGFISSEADGPVETQFMIDQYKKIYALEAFAKNQTDALILEIRAGMRVMFESMKKHCETEINRFSSKSGIAKAFNYFLKNYDGLTLFLTNPRVPIDNNPSERLLRGPVVGRKTWYGTHSKDGAEAAAVHFSLIESCKLNSINPRTYYAELIKRLHAKQPIVTPNEYRKEQSSDSS